MSIKSTRASNESNLEEVNSLLVSNFSNNCIVESTLVLHSDWSNFNALCSASMKSNLDEIPTFSRLIKDLTSESSAVWISENMSEWDGGISLGDVSGSDWIVISTSGGGGRSADFFQARAQ